MNRIKTMHKTYWFQPIIGIMLILLLLVPLTIWELTSNKGVGSTVTTMSFAGLFLGYVLSRGKFGFAGPIKKIVQRGDVRQARLLIVLFMVTTIFAGAAIMAFGANAFGYPRVTPLGVGTIVGGILFGIGMILSTGCASGTLTDVGDGLAPAFLVLIFFMVGSAFGVTFYGSSADVTFLKAGSDTSLSNATGSLWVGVLINIVLLSLLLVIIKFIQKFKDYKNIPVSEVELEIAVKIADGNWELENGSKFFSRNTWEKLFYKRWTWTTAIILISAWFAFIILAMKETPGITGAYAHWGIKIFHGFGIQKANDWMGNWQMMSDAQSWQNIGIIVGAMVSKLFSNKFKLIEWRNQKWYNWVLFAIGGLLMGLGARLARGCNFGALFTGIAFGTGFGWVFGIFLFTSAGLTAWGIRYLRHNTPKELWKR